MRSDSRTDHTDDDREPAEPAAYPVFTGDRDPADIPLQRHGENPFGTPPGGYATPPEPVDEFERGHHHDDEHDGTEYPATEHTADERAAQAPEAGADDSGEHTRHTFADADARTDRSDHGGTDPDEVAVGRATVPGDTPTLDPDEREAVAATAPTPEDYRLAHSVATDPGDREDLDVRPTVLHGTGTGVDEDGGERGAGFHDSDSADDGDARTEALPDLDTSVGHSVAATDSDRGAGFHESDSDADTDRPSTVDSRDTGDVAHTAHTTDPDGDRTSGLPAGAAAAAATAGYFSGRSAHDGTDPDHRPTHHDEEEPATFPATDDASDDTAASGHPTSDSAAHDEEAHDVPHDDTHAETYEETAETAEADGTGEPAEELKPGDAEVAPVPTFWAAADTDGYRDRWREAQLRFVDDPKAAAEEVRGLVGEAVEAVANALTEQRRDLDAWNGEGDGPRDTEQLRVVIQRYRTFFDRLLNL